MCFTEERKFCVGPFLLICKVFNYACSVTALTIILPAKIFVKLFVFFVESVL
jgi:hypothetical protein